MNERLSCGQPFAVMVPVNKPVTDEYEMPVHVALAEVPPLAQLPDVTEQLVDELWPRSAEQEAPARCTQASPASAHTTHALPISLCQN